MLRSLSLATAVLFLSAASASALTFSFDCIKGKSKKCQAGESQLSVEVLDGPSAGQVSFLFHNVGSNDKVNATGLFFDDGAGVLQGLDSVFNSPGTDIGPGGSPSKLPGGKKVDFISDFNATAQKPPKETGLKPGTDVTVNFSLEQGKTLADVLAAIDVSSLRIGVRAGKSFINVPESSVVPEPGSLALLAVAAAALALRSRKS